MPKKPKTSYAVAVVDADGVEVCAHWFLTKHAADPYFEALGAFYPIYTQAASGDTEKLEWVELPQASCILTRTKPQFFPCTIDATNGYLQAMHGVKLSQDDYTWAAFHPYATPTGVPASYTPTVIQELLEPYGFGVTHVRYPTGETFVDETELQAWQRVLGVNPMGQVDRATDNAAFAAASGMPLELVNDMFRFEYCVDAYVPGIVGETGSTVVTSGSRGGHARYVAPRDTHGTWGVALRVAPVAHCRFLCPPPSAKELPRRLGEPTLDLDSCCAPDGSLIVVHTRSAPPGRRKHWEEHEDYPTAGMGWGISEPATGVSKYHTMTEAEWHGYAGYYEGYD